MMTDTEPDTPDVASPTARTMPPVFPVGGRTIRSNRSGRPTAPVHNDQHHHNCRRTRERTSGPCPSPYRQGAHISTRRQCVRRHQRHSSRGDAHASSGNAARCDGHRATLVVPDSHCLEKGQQAGRHSSCLKPCYLPGQPDTSRAALRRPHAPCACSYGHRTTGRAAAGSRTSDGNHLTPQRSRQGG